MIDDDVAVKDSLYTAGRRGVAATVLIEKLVGAAAEAGKDIVYCEELATRLNNRFPLNRYRTVCLCRTRKW